MTNRCERCKYYRPKGACEDFERRTNADDGTEEATISLTWYLDVARTLVKHLSNTYNNELELLKVLLEEE